MLESITIRKFKPEDKEFIRKICCDNAFLGKPIENVFEDRELFADFYTSYYINKEPEHIFVAVDKDNVVGYLISSTNPNHFVSSLSIYIKSISKMIFRYITKRYKKKESYEYVRLALNSMFTPFKIPRKSAHLHFNVDKNYRHMGIGISLMIEFENMLLDKKIKIYYGQFYDKLDNDSRAKIQKIFGFMDYDLKETKMFSNKIKEKIYIKTIKKELSLSNSISNVIESKGLKIDNVDF